MTINKTVWLADESQNENLPCLSDFTKNMFLSRGESSMFIDQNIFYCMRRLDPMPVWPHPSLPTENRDINRFQIVSVVVTFGSYLSMPLK